MDIFSGLVFGLPTFLILLGPLMIVHELGHFWAAKRAGIRVEEFGLGIPPRALKLFERNGTVFSLNWLPFGAFVRMTGEGMTDNMDDPASFSRASIGWRFVTIFAGPFMNFIAAILILFAANMFVASKPVQFAYRIGTVKPGSVAQQMGVQPGDVLLEANGQDITLDDATRVKFNEAGGTPITPIARAAIGHDFQLLVQRGGVFSRHGVALSGAIPATADSNAPLGVSLGLKSIRTERLNFSVPEAFGNSITELGRVMSLMVRVPAELISGRLPIAQARPVGPIGITQLGMEMAREIPDQGPYDFVRFAAILSMLIGVSNLFPFPALDGGRLAFIALEWLRGKRVDPRREQWVHAAGMAFLLGTFVLIAALDILAPAIP